MVLIEPISSSCRLISIQLVPSHLVNSDPKGQLVPKPATIRERESLEAIALLVLEFGRLLMEAGSSARMWTRSPRRLPSGSELNAWTCKWTTRHSL